MGSIQLSFFIFNWVLMCNTQKSLITSTFSHVFAWNFTLLTLWVRRILAFLLFRQHSQRDVSAQNPGMPNPQISQIIGEMWQSLSKESKQEWKDLAEVRP